MDRVSWGLLWDYYSMIIWDYFWDDYGIMGLLWDDYGIMG
jgi:hypothetical protein